MNAVGRSLITALGRSSAPATPKLFDSTTSSFRCSFNHVVRACEVFGG